MTIAIQWDDRTFFKEMNNIIKYSEGFLEGVQSGKNAFLNNLGKTTVDGLKDFIDTLARVDKEMLHHVYEWNMTGSPSSRLFDINYSVVGGGISFDSEFSQSRLAANGATKPFYNKAYIMEKGIPVTISPKKKALRFESNGETVFTKSPVTVNNPGGQRAQGGFESAMNMFFSNYFSQAFLVHSGITEYLKTPTLYKKYLSAGKKYGKSAGVSAGYRWIAKAGTN